MVDLEFQIVDINESYFYSKYNIIICGRMMNKKSVYLTVTDFKPYFYIKLGRIDEDVERGVNVINKSLIVSNFKEYIEENVVKAVDFNSIIITIEVACEYYYFSDYQKYYFLKVEFSSMGTLCAVRKIFQNSNLRIIDNEFKVLNTKTIHKYHKLDVKHSKEDPEIIAANQRDDIPFSELGGKYSGIKVVVYESKLNQYLKFLHNKNILGSDWVNVSNYNELGNISYSDYSITCLSDDIVSVSKNEIAPFIIHSFDIECVSECDGFPDASIKKDFISQISVVMAYFGESVPFKKILISVGGCDEIDGCEVIVCKNEKKLIECWFNIIKEYNPDIITGYNINKFDFKYIYDRCIMLNVRNPCIGRLRKGVTEYFIKGNLADDVEAGSFNDDRLYYYNMSGRVVIDYYQFMKKFFKNLAAYSLDFISQLFINGKVTYMQRSASKTYVYTNDVYGLNVGNYVVIKYYDDYVFKSSCKMKILKIVELNNDKIDEFGGKYKIVLNKSVKMVGSKITWNISKDEITYIELFHMCKNSDEDRAIVGKYCVMDSVLVIKLMHKLKSIMSCVYLSNVAHVSLTSIINEGENKKGYSAIVRYCNIQNHHIPDLITSSNKDTFPGAWVYDTDPVYYKDPIVVLDFGSLYPSSIRANNLSHNSMVRDNRYRNMDGYIYRDVSYTWNEKKDEEFRVNESQTFSERKSGEKDILPMMLGEILMKRKATKKLLKLEKDPFQREILDELQKAYKLTANASYGLLGAKFGGMYMHGLAPSVTASGRAMLFASQRFIEGVFNDCVCLKNDRSKFIPFVVSYLEEHLANDRISNINKYASELFIDINNILNMGDGVSIKVIYGDTDSIFTNFNIRNNGENNSSNKLQKSIDLGVLAGVFFNLVISINQDLEYEKTFYPLMLTAKKKYVGILYENDANVGYLKYMGIALKVRGNSDIVNKIVGELIDNMMSFKTTDFCLKTMRKTLDKIYNNEYGMEYFIMSQHLKSSYKIDIVNVKHAYLAKIMNERVPNSAVAGDRIEFTYKHKDDSDPNKESYRIEDPKYMLANNIPIDYGHFIEKKIINNCVSFLNTILHNKTRSEQFFKIYIRKAELKRLGHGFIDIKSMISNNTVIDKSTEYNNYF